MIIDHCIVRVEQWAGYRKQININLPSEASEEQRT